MAFPVLTFYKFLALADPDETGARLRERLEAFGAKGTVLLSREGVNGSLTVPSEAVDAVKSFLEGPGFFGSLDFKEHRAKTFPFRRLQVRSREEIITFAADGIDPAASPAPYVTPRDLKRWYDEEREMILLDTRNDFELGFGKFKDAENLGLKSFTDFKAIAEKLPEELKNKTIVTYCTGGIRCEKAAPLLSNLGFSEVYQLEGGILNYFDKVGGAYWEGECFVFDNRIAVDSNLEETASSFCCHCQVPIRDPEVKRAFTEAERFCENCQEAVPTHLKPRWAEFLAKRADARKRA